MSITRLDAENEIVTRLGTLINGLNRDDHGVFNSPFRRAFRKLNYTVDYATADADFPEVATADEEPFFDLCIYYTLEMVYYQNTDVDGDGERLSQLADRQKAELDRLRKKIENEHSISLGTRKMRTFRVFSLEDS